MATIDDVARLAARLRRDRTRYLERYGQAACGMMLGDCLWRVYAMIGKLTRRAYLLSSPRRGSDPPLHAGCTPTPRSAVMRPRMRRPQWN